MKWISIMLVMAFTCLHAEEEAPPLSPLLPLTQQIPLEISAENAKRMIDTHEDLRNQQLWEQKALPWTGILTVVAIGLWFLIMKLFPEKAAKPIPDINPKKEARVSLEELSKKRISSEQFYVELTSIVRRYLENQYQLPAIHETTPEFIRNLSTYPKFPKDFRDELSQFLKQADQIKFAKYFPSPSEQSEALNTAVSIVAY